MIFGLCPKSLWSMTHAEIGNNSDQAFKHGKLGDSFCMDKS